MTIGWILVAVITLILVTGTAVVVLDFLPDGQTVPGTRPSVSGPYGDGDACWDCGLDRGEGARLCHWCAELAALQQTAPPP